MCCAQILPNFTIEIIDLDIYAIFVKEVPAMQVLVDCGSVIKLN